MKVGLGYDIHKLRKNRKLILGGTEIQHNKGCLGHSDGDVVIHSLIDALLGASCLGDIGEYFPSTDEKYKDISSTILLQEILTLLKRKKFKVNNIDITIILEEPNLGRYKNLIKKNIASRLKIPISRVNIKAKTNQGLGIVGQKNAITCFCIATIK